MIVISPVLAAITIGLTLLNLVAMRCRAHPPAQPVAPARGRAGGAEPDHGVRRGDDGVDQGRRARERLLRALGGHRRPRRRGAPGDGRRDAAEQLDPDVLRALVSALVLCIGGLRVIDGNLAIGSFVAFQTLLSRSARRSPRSSASVAAADTCRTSSAASTTCSTSQSIPPATRPSSARLRRRARRDSRRARARRRQLRLQAHGPAADRGLQPVARAGRPGRDRRRVGQRQVDARAPDRRPARAVVRDGAASTAATAMRSRGSVLDNSIAMVDQGIALFAGTVRDNLTLWDDAVPDDDVVRARRWTPRSTTTSSAGPGRTRRPWRTAA